MRGRWMAVVAVLGVVAQPGVASSAWVHEESFILGGVGAVQEVHHYRFPAQAGDVLAVRMDVLSLADLDLVLYRVPAGGCPSPGCGFVVAHRMAAFDTPVLLELRLDQAATYFVEVESWVAAPGTRYALSIALDAEAAIVTGPERFIAIPLPILYLHKSEDVLGQL